MSMTRIQYLLSKLAEEAAELSVIAQKTQQFGVNEYYAKMQPIASNIERVQDEFNDVLAVVEAINTELGADAIERNPGHILRKLDKIEHYYRYSQQCGQTEVKK